MSRVAALLVTRDAEAWLPALLAGVAGQSWPVDRLVVVDDGSRDGTRDLLAQSGAEVISAVSTETDRVTRIAQNFVQGVRACSDVDVVVLGDHDDVWHVDRVAHQAGLLGRVPSALLAAGDGRLVDDAGLPVGGTLRSAFPLPVDWAKRSPAQRMAAALRVSVATGGASALRPGAFPTLEVPPGWLHDRWWSLVALARDGLLTDDEVVIDYRVQSGQQVGLDRAAQADGGAVGRVSALMHDAGRSWRKARDLRTRLRPLTVSAPIADAISLRNVLGLGH